jgi:hypothetical protein
MDSWSEKMEDSPIQNNSLTVLCTQSPLFSMSIEQASPRAAKSAERIEGAMIAGGDMVH